MLRINRKTTSLTLYFIIMSFFNVFADEPITTDSRVKTYIYSPNEIFQLNIFHGYQTSVEFAKGEEISTISMGDSYAWQINTVGNRLFIKPMEENMHTNMTIITNKHDYHFDLFSKKLDDKYLKDLVYVLRFYYPEDPELEQNSVVQNTDKAVVSPQISNEDDDDK